VSRTWPSASASPPKPSAGTSPPWKPPEASAGCTAARSPRTASAPRKKASWNGPSSGSPKRPGSPRPPWPSFLSARAAGAAAQGTVPASGSDAELVVITHSLPIASRLSGGPGIALHLLGGKVRGLTQAAVGQSTVEAARRIRPDIAFIGTNGIHAAFGLSTPDPEEAAVKAAFVQSARRIVVLADSSKLDAETLVQFASLKDLDTVITDSQPSRELADALAEAGVEVVVA